MAKRTSFRLVGAFLGLALAGCGVNPVARGVGQRATAPVVQQTLRSSDTMAGLVEDAFILADKDRDGVLSGQESGLSSAQFRLLDRDSDGVISKDEWNYDLPPAQFEQALAPFLPVVNQTFKAIDINHDGRLSSEEVRALAPANSLEKSNGAPEPLKPSVVRDALSMADENRDGQIVPSEFTNFYTIISQDGGSRGIFSNIAQALLGGYLAVTSRIGARVAMHPNRKKNDQGTPAIFGFGYDDIEFKTSDGLTIRGWYIPAANPTDKTVIEVHGISDCRDTFVREKQIRMLHDQYNQIAFDLRNQGTSDGKITSFGLYEARDVLAAVNWAKAHGSRHIVTYGISLGAAGVLNAAAQDPTIEGVVDDCAFSTVRSAFAGFVSIDFVPCAELVGAAILVRGNQELGADMSSTQPISVIRHINPRPLLIVHGEKDPCVASEQSWLNYQAAGEGFHKELWIAPGGGHANSAVIQPDQYRDHLVKFLNVAFSQSLKVPALKI